MTRSDTPSFLSGKSSSVVSRHDQEIQGTRDQNLSSKDILRAAILGSLLHLARVYPLLSWLRVYLRVPSALPATEDRVEF